MPSTYNLDGRKLWNLLSFSAFVVDNNIALTGARDQQGERQWSASPRAGVSVYLASRVRSHQRLFCVSAWSLWWRRRHAARGGLDGPLHLRPAHAPLFSRALPRPAAYIVARQRESRKFDASFFSFVRALEWEWVRFFLRKERERWHVNKRVPCTRKRAQWHILELLSGRRVFEMALFNLERAHLFHIKGVLNRARKI